MRIERITHSNDQRVRDYVGVGDPALLRDGLFVAEGRLVVSRVLDSMHYRTRSVLVTEAAHASLADTLQRTPYDLNVYVADLEVIQGITGFHLHRGCLALVERPAPRSADDVLRRSRHLLVLERVGDADNMGAAMRNAAAFGAGVLLSPGCCDPLYRKAIRTSSGTALIVPFAQLDSWPDGMVAVRGAGFTIAALTPCASAVPIDQFLSAPRHHRLAWLLGTEGDGLSEGAFAHADVRVRIPISTDVDSLNVATAAAIALYMTRTRKETGERRQEKG